MKTHGSRGINIIAVIAITILVLGANLHRYPWQSNEERISNGIKNEGNIVSGEEMIDATTSVPDTTEIPGHFPDETDEMVPVEFNSLKYYFPSGILPILASWKVDTITGNDSWAVAETKYFKHLKMIQVECHHRRRMGLVTDGGWHVCLTEPYLPPHNNCLVYSFGLNWDLSFDDAMADTFGCEVHSFDPTMLDTDPKRGQHINFHLIGLYGEKKDININKRHIVSKYPADTFGNIVDMLGHQQRTIDFLKFDIESSEWSALPEMISSGRLNNVKQLAFEMHSGQAKAVNYRIYLQFQKGLFDAGFRLWHSEWNLRTILNSQAVEKGFFTTCQELYYININFLRRD